MKIPNSFSKCVTVAFLVLSIIFWAYVGFCDEKNKSYHYNPSGKLDPFKPLIETVKKKEAFKSPLQKMSIDDIELVGIAKSGKERFAMVEGLRGKRHHYVLHKGTPVGTNQGRVEKILTDQVIIIERIKDPSGKVKIKRVILKLRTEEKEEKP